jgi:hypothetical protein
MPEANVLAPAGVNGLDERDSLASPRSLALASCRRLATSNYMRDKKSWRLFCAMAAFKIKMSFHI